MSAVIIPIGNIQRNYSIQVQEVFGEYFGEQPEYKKSVRAGKICVHILVPVYAQDTHEMVKRRTDILVNTLHEALSRNPGLIHKLNMVKDPDSGKE